jgi:hypothetical protein
MSDNGLSEFSDFVAAGLPLIQQRNESAWELGDLIVQAVKVCHIGRPPTDGEEYPTLSDLAHEWDERVQKLSYWRINADFYPPNIRQPELSFAHHDLARRHSGGDPDIALDNALELLDKARSYHMGIAAFRRHVDGVYFEGPMPVVKMPIELHDLVPSGVTEVWAVFKRRDE